MVTMTNQEYRAYVRSLSPTSPLWKDALRAFLTGGLICALGQLMRQGWLAFGLEEEAAGQILSLISLRLQLSLRSDHKIP